MASLPDVRTGLGGTTLTLVSQTWLEHAKVAIRWVVVVATVAVLFRVGSNHGSDLAAIELDFNIFWMANAAAATTAANLLLPLGWRQIIIAFDQVLATGPALYYTTTYALCVNGRAHRSIFNLEDCTSF